MQSKPRSPRNTTFREVRDKRLDGTVSKKPAAEMTAIGRPRPDRNIRRVQVDFDGLHGVRRIPSGPLAGGKAIQSGPVDSNQAAFVDRLCNSFPALERLRGEHLREDFGELLPHLFLGDVARHAISLFGSTNELARQELRRLCDFLEREYTSGTDSVRDLIALGFLENLAGPPEPYWRIRTLLGSELRKAIEEMWDSSE